MSLALLIQSTDKGAYNRLRQLPCSIQGQGDSEEFGSPTL